MIRSLSFLLSGALFTAYAQTSCDALKSSLSFPDATITAIESMPRAGSQLPRDAGGAAAAPAAQAAGRGGRGAAPAAPVQHVAGLLPRRSYNQAVDRLQHRHGSLAAAENWNNKFQMVGNGGWAGSIQGFAQMQAALREGYATAGTDTGHSGDAVFAAGASRKAGRFRIPRHA